MSTATRPALPDMPQGGGKYRVVDLVRLAVFWTVLLLIGAILVFNAVRGPQIRVQWATENELDIVGFNLYRARSSDGEFVRINDTIIPPAADPLLGGDHVYIDSQVRWLQSYHYTLESVDRVGQKERTEPIVLSAGLTLPFR